MQKHIYIPGQVSDDDSDVIGDDDDPQVRECWLQDLGRSSDDERGAKQQTEDWGWHSRGRPLVPRSVSVSVSSSVSVQTSASRYHWPGMKCAGDLILKYDNQKKAGPSSIKAVQLK